MFPNKVMARYRKGTVSGFCLFVLLVLNLTLLVMMHCSAAVKMTMKTISSVFIGKLIWMFIFKVF